MKNTCLILLCCFVVTPTLAQRGWPPVYVIQSDTGAISLDTTYYQALEDPTGSLTFAQVQRSDGFRYVKQYDPSRTAHVYWLRMQLRNDSPRALDLFVRLFADYIDFYWPDSLNRWQHRRSGNLVSNQNLPVQPGGKDHSRLYFRLPAGQQIVVYGRIENAFWNAPIAYLSIDLQTVSNRQQEVFQRFWQQEGRKQYVFAGIAIGMLLLAMSYNLLVFFSTRERVYLYFGLCLLFFVLDRPETRPFLELAFLSDYAYFIELSSRFTFILFFFLFIQSIRQFVSSFSSLKHLDRLVAVSLFITVLMLAGWFTVLSVSVKWSNDLSILMEAAIRVTYGLCLLMTYRAMRWGTTDARYVFIAILPLFIWWLYSLTTNVLGAYANINVGMNLPGAFQYAESFCFAWMILFFSAALINRYNQTRQQVTKQALERERLEHERSRLIASQNERLEQQVRERTAELQQSLETLRATQDQLVQKEKLASLGELTAGIAHEIQNPLNFVNNFAEVSVELVDELQEEREKNIEKRDAALEDELLGDLRQNLQKINQHGKRAGAIVRGMLEHSRASTGEKTPTNLNALADEYLRLAYHGMRAKDKTGPASRFNCTLSTNFDATLPTVTISSQDVGRVLLNLFNNAFYAVQQRAAGEGQGAYQPTIWVSTQSVQGMAEIRVRDNGIGIPDALKQKIFQPFFTTKPTGEGTGLGLSLSYDIITKGHGGTLTVESREGEGTEFIIRLPTA